MTRFWREGHYRWGKYGEHWVEGHWVDRDSWSSTWAYSAVPPSSSSGGTSAKVGSYVDPNARCPVCGAEVYFYSNEFGSRVYFDDLGPPWPKHPCMDTSSPGTSVGSGERTAQARASSGIRSRVTVNSIDDSIHIPGVFEVIAVTKKGPRRVLVLQEFGGERIQIIVSPPAPPIGGIAVSQGVWLHWFDPATGDSGKNLVWHTS